jgi:hypothetical protein
MISTLATSVEPRHILGAGKHMKNNPEATRVTLVRGESTLIRVMYHRARKSAPIRLLRMLSYQPDVRNRTSFQHEWSSQELPQLVRSRIHFDHYAKRLRLTAPSTLDNHKWHSPY